MKNRSQGFPTDVAKESKLVALKRLKKLGTHARRGIHTIAVTCKRITIASGAMLLPIRAVHSLYRILPENVWAELLDAQLRAGKKLSDFLSLITSLVFVIVAAQFFYSHALERGKLIVNLSTVLALGCSVVGLTLIWRIFLVSLFYFSKSARQSPLGGKVENSWMLAIGIAVALVCTADVLIGVWQLAMALANIANLNK